MDRVQVFIDKCLSHADPKYYDPVKAHEYYLRNRELKGNGFAKGKRGEKQREAAAYSKAQIGAAKKTDIAAASAEKDAQIAKARNIAETKRAEIREKLSVLLEKLTKNTADEVESKIAALPAIPKGISKEKRAELAAERREEIAKIRGDAQSANDKKSARASSASDREATSTQLKATIESARANYETLKETLKAKYEQETQDEFEAIRQNV